LGVGNDPRYNKTRCFDPFPFPACTDAQKQCIREFGEALDAHRKRQQAQHPELTITGMYNVLERLRNEETLSDKERVIHEHGLVSVLRKLHDDLDAAVFDAYGWSHILTYEQILERLVTLNAERAEEEETGRIRWLRPEFQNPAGITPAKQQVLAQTESEGEAAAPVAAEAKLWPKKRAEQTAAVRDRVATAAGRMVSLADVAAGFKRAPRKDVEETLDSLAAVGVITAYETSDGKLWRSATRAR